MQRGVGALLRAVQPGQFAIVMATGIVSLAAWLDGMVAVATALFAINQAVYVALWALLLARLATERGSFVAALRDAARTPSLLTIVAGTSVLGKQFSALAHADAVARGLWLLACALWLILSYAFFGSVALSQEKEGPESYPDGGWLLTVVATQSVALLGAGLAPGFGGAEDVVLFLALAAYLLGYMLYLFVSFLVLERLLFRPLTAEEFLPSYWINMGAVAITTLAGATLISNVADWRFLGDILPFLDGFTIFAWAIATWWIPLLVIFTLWRYLHRRYPVRYDLLYWSAVFPLGMYTVCTFELAGTLNLPFLAAVPRRFVFVALAAWLCTFLGLVVHLVRPIVAGLRSHVRPPSR